MFHFQFGGIGGLNPPKTPVATGLGGHSAWCEGNRFEVGGPGPGNENFLAELSQSLVFLHICLSDVDGPVLTWPPVPPSVTATQLRNLVKITTVRKASSYEP